MFRVLTLFNSSSIHPRSPMLPLISITLILLGVLKTFYVLPRFNHLFLARTHSSLLLDLCGQHKSVNAAHWKLRSMNPEMPK